MGEPGCSNNEITKETENSRESPEEAKDLTESRKVGSTENNPANSSAVELIESEEKEDKRPVAYVVKNRVKLLCKARLDEWASTSKLNFEEGIPMMQIKEDLLEMELQIADYDKQAEVRRTEQAIKANSAGFEKGATGLKRAGEFDDDGLATPEGPQIKRQRENFNDTGKSLTPSSLSGLDDDDIMEYYEISSSNDSDDSVRVIMPSIEQKRQANGMGVVTRLGSGGKTGVSSSTEPGASNCNESQQEDAIPGRPEVSSSVGNSNETGNCDSGKEEDGKVNTYLNGNDDDDVEFIECVKPSFKH